MSMNPELRTAAPEDEIVTLLSEWLAFDVSNPDLRRRLLDIGTDGLSAEQAGAVDELVEELDEAVPTERGDLEMLVRETLEAVALG
jgi:hypothetical protein